MISTCSMPSSCMRAQRCSGEVISRGARAGATTLLGCGWKVRAEALSSRSTATSFTRLGVGTYQQDCGPGCVGTTNPPAEYYVCPGGTCSPTGVGLAQQVTHPVWVLPQDNNGVLLQLPTIPSGGTTTVNGSLFIGIGTQANNALGSATVFNT